MIRQLPAPHPILRLVADFLLIFGVLLLIPLGIALFTGEQQQALTFGVMAAVFLVSMFWLRQSLPSPVIKERHAAIALAAGWILYSLFSAVPFIVFGLQPVDAFFEAFSGWSDTGLTMIPDPGILPYSLGFFRVLTQWVSGLGIVMFMLFLRGDSARAARGLFEAEGRFEDFTFNLWHIGRTVTLIYLAYTLVGFLGLWATGVPAFHALTHAITSLSTGGFSSNSVGVGLYGAAPSLVAMTIMLVGGISFSSHQALMVGKWRKMWNNPEVRALLVIIPLFAGLLLLELHITGSNPGEQILNGFFYVVSAVTTCGAGTTLQLSHLPDRVIFTLIFLMMTGAAYGSTTGGIKLWRVLIIFKLIQREIRRPFYPPGTLLPIRMGNNIVSDQTAIQIMAFVLLYLGIGMVGALFFMLFGYRALDALFTVFSAQGNVGLNAMPNALYYGMHPILKIQLMLHMFIGRVEIFPLIYLLRSFRSQ
ncbi:hypothetical protein ADN00_03250 [Ornatilinea apprima]|uniref:Cation transporter n=1 Tax=Ornatilinea apprima TaxID=1134406 RepID=A0A0N8GNY0_9CHLR|nr:TrkH family potassium uptake protein [Ornatilinea apprima]KPL79354.1 hypothetical protein ADN00_03250 [Ornatilinea apprima]